MNTINAGQARKFAKKLKLHDLEKVDGKWIAYDGAPKDDGGEPYVITSDAYYAALNEGDLS